MSTEAVIDTSNLPIVADTSEQGDSPQELQARFDALVRASSAPEAKEETAKPEKPAGEEKPALETVPKEGEQATLVEPETATPKAKEKWGELRKKADAYDTIAAEKAAIEQERETLRQQLEEIKKDDPAVYKKQIEEKDKELASYEQKVALLDVKASKEYLQTVAEPYLKIENDVALIARTNEMEEAASIALIQALNIHDPARQRKVITELTAELNDADRGEILAHAREVRKLAEKHVELEAKASEAKKELEFRRHQEAEAAKKQAETQMTEARKVVWEKMTEVLPILNDEAIAKAVRDVKINLNDPAMIVYGAMSGELIPRLQTALTAALAEVAQLKAASTARNKATPQAGTQTVTTTERPTAGLPEGETVAERFANFNRSAAA